MPAREPRTLEHLPHEVLAQIAEHLDRPSAFALALTCRSLRDAGEMGVWKDLDVVSDFTREHTLFSL